MILFQKKITAGLVVGCTQALIDRPHYHLLSVLGSTGSHISRIRDDISDVFHVRVTVPFGSVFVLFSANQPGGGIANAKWSGGREKWSRTGV